MCVGEEDWAGRYVRAKADTTCDRVGHGRVAGILLQVNAHDMGGLREDRGGAGARTRATGIAAETPRAAIFLPEEAGGAGHMHAYAYAAAAYIDQFHRALSGGEGEPARVVVSERIAATCRRLGCTEAPLMWEPPVDVVLSEDDMVEAWLLAKRRAGMRGVQTDALLPTELSCCALCDG